MGNSSKTNILAFLLHKISFSYFITIGDPFKLFYYSLNLKVFIGLVVSFLIIALVVVIVIGIFMFKEFLYKHNSNTIIINIVPALINTYKFLFSMLFIRMLL